MLKSGFQFILCFLSLFSIHGFTIKYNHKVPFICEVHNIDIRNLDDMLIHDLQHLFRATPVLLFKNQHVTPQQQFEFLDYLIRSLLQILFIHSRYNDPECPQTALRGKDI